MSIERFDHTAVRLPHLSSWLRFGGLLWLVVLLSLTGCFSHWNLTAQDHVNQALHQYRQGDPKAGIIELHNALKLEPGNAAIQMLLARFQFGAGRLTDAELTLRQVRNLQQSPDWKILLAEIYLATQRARTLVEELTPDLYDPLEIRVGLLALRGRAYTDLGEMNLAREALGQALSLAPDHQGARLSLARLGLEEGNLEAANGEVERILAAEPDLPNALMLKGRIEQARDNPAGALKAFNGILKQHPWNVEARLGRIEILHRVNELDLALDEVRVLTRALPGLARGLYLEGLIQYKRQQYESAYTVLQQLMVVEDGHPDSRYLLGLTCYRLNRLSEARENLAAALELQPERQLDIRRALALVEQHLNRPEQIVQVLEPAITLAPEDSQILTLLGNAYLQTGHYAKGTHYLEKAVGLNPQLVQANMRLALSYLGANDLEAATRTLEQIALTRPPSLEVDTLLVLTRLQRGETGSALQTAREMTREHAEMPMAWNLLGLVEGIRGDHEQARAAFLEALERTPGDTVALLNLARLDELAGHVDGARERYRQVLAAEPGNLDTLLALSNLEQGDEAGRWLEQAWEAHPDSLRAGLALARHAINHYRSYRVEEIIQALEQAHPNDPRVLAATGQLLQDTALTAQALARFTRLTELWPERVEAWYQLALTQRAMQQLPEATTSTLQALDTQWNHRPSLYLLTDLYLQQNRLDEAYRNAARLAALSPEELRAHRLLARVEVRRGRIEAAVAALSRKAPLDRLEDWLQEHPHDVGVRQQRAALRTLSGDYAGAVADYRQLLEIRPDDPTFLNELAWLYHQQQDDRDQETARRAARLAPQRPDIADTLGWILINRGEIREGTAFIEKAAILAPDIPVVHYHLAVGYHLSGRDQQARELLEKLLRTPTDFSEAPEARRLLARLRKAGNAG